MTLQTERLYFITSHLPGVIERLVVLLSALLILIPLLSILSNLCKSTCKKAVEGSLGIMYLARVEITRASIKMRALETYTIPDSPALGPSLSRSADSVPLDSIDSETILPDAIVPEVIVPEFFDTGVCFLPEIPSSMIAGLANTGNSCFLNSVLQSSSSLPKLHAYLNQINSNYSKDQNLPVTRSLLKTLQLLSTPTDDVFRPTDVVTALAINDRVVNREQQDAQELYQLLVSALENELESNNNLTENPLNGLLGHRITCNECNYSSGYYLQPFNNVQLTVPHAASTTLDECFLQLTSKETLEGVECSNCSLVKSLQNVNSEIESLTLQPKQTERLAVFQTLKQEIERRLQAGESDLDDKIDAQFKKLLKISKGPKTKQVMFVKPPKVLCLHFVRYIYWFTGEIIKNTCRIDFPEVLDLSNFCTNGTADTQPNSPTSKLNTSVTFKYRLMSSIVHLGVDNAGHYIAYKRRIFTEKCQCKRCGQEDGAITKLKPHDSEWFKTSDDTVVPCKIEDALAEKNPFMLMYELIDDEDDN